MRHQWPGAVFYDMVACDFHADQKYKNQCLARSCSLLSAHEAA
ncbi:unnamed protein product [Gongylonema pulchrum]|uniref:Transposase n=1 Tax=Gongylonema pulchrum TaxID=637853 RepID=A0A183EB27_9BILA|nr:unnamed protein product [Gongylonema pulchrum]